MNAKVKQILFVSFILILAAAISACTPATPTPGTGRGFAYIWYMATDGDDDNSCSEPDEPCATLTATLQKASAINADLEADYPDLLRVDHTINVAAGTYNAVGRVEGYPIAGININVSIEGAGRTATEFNAGNLYGGFAINGDVDVTIRDLQISDVRGTAPDSCVNVRGVARVTLRDVVLLNCGRSGIATGGDTTTTLIDVRSSRNVTMDPFPGTGYGVMNAGEMVIERGRFAANEAAGILNSGNLQASDTQIFHNDHSGLFIVGTATLDNLTIENNGQDGSFRAGLYLVTGADVTINDSLIDSNQFGIWAVDGNLEVNGSDVTNNPRTGIIVEAGETRINESTISGNADSYYNTSLGGGIENDGRLILRTSSVTENGNGGIRNNGDGELFLIESDISANQGGMPALFNQGTAVIERSLFADNIINDVSTTLFAVENRGSMVMINGTISGNNHGGLNAVSGTLTMAYSTITGNGNIGLNTFAGGEVVGFLANSIVALNSNGDCSMSTATDIPIIPLGGPSIDSDGTCTFAAHTYDADELHLGELADNGGPTWTHALLDDSPAIEGASGSCPTSDQRNLTRPFGLACDIGAYEAGATTLSLDADDFDLDLATITPTPEGEGGAGILIAIPDRNYNCRYGNSSVFDIADTLYQGEEYQPVGQGSDGLWLQFRGPAFDQLCWAPTQGFTLYLDGDEVELPNLPADLLGVKAYPATPTPTEDPDESYDVTPTPTPTPADTKTPKPSATPTCDPQQQQCP